MALIHLYTTYYNERKDSRRQELLECVEKNVLNSAIASLTLFNEGKSIKTIHPEKIIEIPIERRPTYSDFINYINSLSKSDDIHVIANTDIFFDSNIAVLKTLNLDEVCLALSRWDTTEFKRPKLYNHNDSQDVWVFKGKIRTNLEADFQLGVPRCDNRFMHEIEEAGYKVLNPAFSIKAFHIHKGQRALVYTENDNIYKIARPYKYKYPHNLFGFWKTIFYNLSHKAKLGHYRYDIKKVNFWLPVRLIRKVIELVTRKKMPLVGYKENV